MNNSEPARPVAVVDERRCKNNIRRIATKAKENNCTFRPHFKTHQSNVIGDWFREEGVTGITVSTPDMAEYFINNSWDDVTLAFPFFPAQLNRIKELQAKSYIRLFVYDTKMVRYLDKHLSAPVGIMIEADAGYNRSGVADIEIIHQIVSEIEKSTVLEFKGFYSHDGDTYKVQGEMEVRKIAERNLKFFRKLSEFYPDANYCLGDTPSGSLMDSFPGANEISPGNLVFYDWMQTQIGSCSLDDVSLLVKAPIGQIKDESNMLIMHCGAVHLSKDHITVDGNVHYGKPVYYDDGVIKPVEGAFVESLSQEHGIVRMSDHLRKVINGKNHLLICPVHSCLTANLFEHYENRNGEKISKRVLS